MADVQSKIDIATDKAKATASDKSSVDVAAVHDAVSADTSAPVKVDTVAKAIAAKPKKTVRKPKPAAQKSATSNPADATNAEAEAQIAAQPAASAKLSIKTLKDTIMANAKTEEYTTKAKEMAADMQTRAKSAYDKGAELTQDVVEFQKGNFEAMVASGKILATGMQDMSRAYVEDAKAAAQTVQDDVRKMAAIKSPTELFQLQGEIARRNFDAMVSTTSKNTEAMLKLATEAFAPLSSRMSVAADKLRKAA